MEIVKYCTPVEAVCWKKKGKVGVARVVGESASGISPEKCTSPTRWRKSTQFIGVHPSGVIRGKHRKRLKRSKTSIIRGFHFVCGNSDIFGSYREQPDEVLALHGIGPKRYNNTDICPGKSFLLFYFSTITIFLEKGRNMSEKSGKDNKKRSRTTPDNSMNGSMAQAPKNLRKSSSTDVDGNASQRANESYSNLHERKGNSEESGSLESGTVDWSLVDEELLLSDDPSFAVHGGNPPTGSTPKSESEGSHESSQSLNNTVVDPPPFMKDLLASRARGSEVDIENPMETDQVEAELEMSEAVSAVEAAMERCSTSDNSASTFTPTNTRPAKKKLDPQEKQEGKPLREYSFDKFIKRVTLTLFLIEILAKRIKMTSKMIISTDDYPASIIDIKLKDELMEYVRVALHAQKEVEGENAVEPVGFGPNRLRGGQLVVVCNNYRTSVWLNKTVKRASADRALSTRNTLVCKPIANMNPSPSFTLWHERSLINFEEVKAEIQREVAIITNNWQLLNEKKIPINANGGGGGIRFTFLGSRELTALMGPDRTKQLNYGLMGRPVFIRWLKGENEEEVGELRSHNCKPKLILSFKIVTQMKPKRDANVRPVSRRSSLGRKRFKRSSTQLWHRATTTGRTSQRLRHKANRRLTRHTEGFTHREASETAPHLNSFAQRSGLKANEKNYFATNVSRYVLNYLLNYLYRIIDLIAFLGNVATTQHYVNKLFSLHNKWLVEKCVFTYSYVPRKGITLSKEGGRKEFNGS